MKIKKITSQFLIIITLIFLSILFSCSSEEDEDEGDETFNFGISDVANIEWNAIFFLIRDINGDEDNDVDAAGGSGNVTLIINGDDTFRFNINSPSLPDMEIISTGRIVISDGDLFLTFDNASTELQPYIAFLSEDGNQLRLNGGLFFIDIDSDGTFETAELSSRFMRQ